MIRIAICDDDKAQLQTLKKLVCEFAETVKTRTIHIQEFSSGESLCNYVIANEAFDVYVLDVIMPAFNGIQAGIELRKYDKSGKIIYLTSSPDYAVDSYIAEAFYYLLKPPKKDKLFEILNRAVEDIAKKKEKSIKVKTASEMIILPLDNIMYVTLSKKALVYYLKNGKSVESLSQREAFSVCCAPLLEDSRFALCGASTCLNMFYIKSVDKESVTFNDATKLFLPKKACAKLRTDWLDFWFMEEQK